MPLISVSSVFKASLLKIRYVKLKICIIRYGGGGTITAIIFRI